MVFGRRLVPEDGMVVALAGRAHRHRVECIVRLWADPVAALGMTYFLVREGRQAWLADRCCD